MTYSEAYYYFLNNIMKNDIELIYIYTDEDYGMAIVCYMNVITHAIYKTSIEKDFDEQIIENPTRKAIFTIEYE